MDLLAWLPDTALRLFLRMGTILLALNILAFALCLYAGSDFTIALISTLVALAVTMGARQLLRRRKH